MFLFRFDYLSKKGGDVIQIENYCKELALKKYHSSISGGSNWLNDVKYADYIFLVNIDRPLETIYYFEEIKRLFPEKKVYVIPIHHPIKAINRFDRSARGFKHKVLCGLVPDFYNREKIKNLIRFKLDYKMLSLSIKHLFYNYHKKINNLIECSDGVVFISEGEKNSVFGDFDIASDNYKVAYNAVDIIDSVEVVETEKTIDFIIVGRIEPRKNQMSILKALVGKGYKITVVGHLNSNSKKYCSDVLDFIDANEGVDYLGGVSHSSVLELLVKSKVLINASYFEVNPLVDLEAALCGCQVVTTLYSYTLESLPGSYSVDPWDIEDIYKKSKIAINADNILDLSKISTNWSAAADKIIEVIS